MNFESWFKKQHPSVPVNSALAVLQLSAEGATVPFIARYRKERTGNLDEVGIQTSIDAKEKWDAIVKRQEFIVLEIENQKKLTPELKEKVLATFDLDQLEDIYLPYKQKRKTKAALAKEAGLLPFADWIWNCGHGTETPQPGQTLEIWAFTFRNEEKGFKEAPEVIAGAQDILVERLSEIQELRQRVRENMFKRAVVKTAKAAKAKANSKFEKYFSFEESIGTLLLPQNSHRYLALRRGWMEEEITLGIGAASKDPTLENELYDAFEKNACTVPDSPGAGVLLKSSRLALKAHVMPSIENEIHKALKEVADSVAIRVFSDNLRKLLLSSPFGSKAVMGIDPGIRTGCKMALVDASGKYLGNAVLHLKTDEEKANSKKLLEETFKLITVEAVAVGNGTAGRETEIYLRGVLKEMGVSAPVVMVNEAGASVYSASEVAREEFPELDVTIRGAISIARRLQDPLAELVKIEPKSIGVGQYQHDVSPHSLKKGLELVVDSCVNTVGVDVNTASYHLLSHVSGIGTNLAKSIVGHRQEKGLFASRQQLLNIPYFTDKTFEQAAGFLRIVGGENPLDNTAVHPERYAVLQGFAERLGVGIQDLLGSSGVEKIKGDTALRSELGEFTFNDVVGELERPGRDPRDSFVPFSFREDIHELKDLQPAMWCPGVVTNVTNFGAFVDIGVHQDGLVHLSQLSEKFVKDPKEVVSPGDRVKVRVLEVNLEKKQISLSMRQEAAPRPAPKPVAVQKPRPREASHPVGNRPANPRDSARDSGPRRPPPRDNRPPKSKFTSNAFSVLSALKEKKP